MRSSSVTVSPAFRRQTVKAVLTIILFIIVYVLMFLLSLGLTFLCGWAAMMLLSFSVSYITLALGFGLVCMGGIVTYFLMKFIFSRHTVDRSHLTEITREEEPQLFAMIEEIVQEVKTDFPKKIYLSSDLNAAVFYDSSFWSMFFPIRKNLEIGMGLVNSVTQLELKAVLAHEFGHFSQRSMKLGSFVYNVNKVIFNMLYDNESYQRNVSGLANVSGFVAFFAHISIGIVQGIQSVLQQMYKLVNITYMGLSREMEFHADEVAANVAGSGPLMSSLLRFELADEAMNRVLTAYNQRYQQSLVSGNLYRQQRWMMEYLSRGNGLALAGGLPQVTLGDVQRYNQSKLVIKNQWASHPATEDRVAALERLNIHREEETLRPAGDIFTDVLKRQEELTARVFSVVTYPAAVVTEEMETFTKFYEKEHPLHLAPKVFNTYYDLWNTEIFPGGKAPEGTVPKTPETLFSDEMVNLAHSLGVLEKDKATLHQLTVVEHNIKTFDYDGVKYSMNDIYTLIERIDATIAENKAQLKANDAAALVYFNELAAKKGRVEEWEKLYGTFYESESKVEERSAVYNKVVEAIRFMQERLQYAEIINRMGDVEKAEKEFKPMLPVMLEEEANKSVVTPEQDALLRKYALETSPYFVDQSYNDETVQQMYDALRAFLSVMGQGRSRAKLAMLEFCAQFMEKEEAVPVA